MRNRKVALIISVSMISMLWGCVNRASQSVTPESIQNINAGLAQVTLINESDLLSDEKGYRFDAIRKIFRQKQCVSEVANPVLLIARPTIISLRTDSGDSGNSRPVGSAAPGGSTNNFPENGLGIPLRVSTIADLPNEYLKEMVALMETKGLPAEIKSKLSKEIPGNYEKLIARVNGLVNDYDPAKCAEQLRDNRLQEARKNMSIIFMPPTF